MDMTGVQVAYWLSDLGLFALGYLAGQLIAAVHDIVTTERNRARRKDRP